MELGQSTVLGLAIVWEGGDAEPIVAMDQRW
jgi:hypothetical protein